MPNFLLFTVGFALTFTSCLAHTFVISSSYTAEVGGTVVGIVVLSVVGGAVVVGDSVVVVLS